jgi:hypothetical protein
MNMKLICAFSAVLALSGCANWSSVYRTYQVNTTSTATTAVVDVKQRAIISNTRTVGNETRTVVCAEPSPDALSVIAAGVGASVSAGSGKALDFALSQTESGAFIGNRTATIQLLRDMLYRACEMYAAGAISDDNYYQFQRRYQIMTMGLLAIEHVTGVVKPGSLALSAGGAEASAFNANLAKKRTDLADAMANQELAKIKVDVSTKSVADAKAALSAATADADKKVKQDAVKKAEDDLAVTTKDGLKSNANAKLLQKEYENAGSAGVRAEVSGGSLLSAAASAPASTGSSATDAAVSVANTAKEIVSLIVNSAFRQEACFAAQQFGKEKGVTCLVEGLKVASDSCGGLADQALAQCLKQNLPVGISADQVQQGTVLRAWAQTEQSQPNAQKESVRDTVRALLPNPGFDQLRYDVFATPSMVEEQKRVEKGLLAAGAKDVRRRPVTEIECAGRWKVDRHSIRYDVDSQGELAALETVKRLVKEALSIDISKVVSTPVNEPTPLYMSVFLCKK